MNLSESELRILKNVRHFSKLRRYCGTLPEKYMILYSKDTIDRLIADDYLELAVMSSPLRGARKGLRLGPAGKKRIDEAEIPVVKDGNADVPIELVDIMEDIHHFSSIGRYRGMMPGKMAKEYEPSDLEDLLNHGYVLKVKIKWAEGGKDEGFVLSMRAYRLLRSLGTI